MSCALRHLRLFLFVVLSLTGAGVARADPPAAGDLPQRVVLAEKMVTIRPVRSQVERAVDAYIAVALRGRSESERELFRVRMLGAINADALEKITVDAYADTFTKEELAAMVEYYAKPEARSAAEKEAGLSEKISPEIIRMLDQAVMKARTQP